MRPDRLLTFRLTAIMLPYVLLICGTAFLGAILQVHKRFAAPAAAPILLNVCHIVVVFVGARILHLRHSTDPDWSWDFRRVSPTGWLFCSRCGRVAVCLLLPGLRGVGFRFRLALHFWTPPIRKMLRLTLPVAMGAGVLQLSVLLDKAISVALMAGSGPRRAVGKSFHISRPQRAISDGTGRAGPAQPRAVSLPVPAGRLCNCAGHRDFPRTQRRCAGQGQETIQRACCASGIEATLWEGIPASIGLILVRDAAVRLLFQHGQIGAHDAALISQSVLYYSGAIWAFSLLQILNRAYYAMHDTLTPLLMSVLNIVLNLVVEIPLLWWLGEAGMAVGTLVSFAIQAVLTLWLLDRRVEGWNSSGSPCRSMKMCIAAGVMWGVCLLVQHLPGYPHSATRLSWLMQSLRLMMLARAFTSWMCASWAWKRSARYCRPGGVAA